jgi:hypothetical protein
MMGSTLRAAVVGVGTLLASIPLGCGGAATQDALGSTGSSGSAAQPGTSSSDGGKSDASSADAATDAAAPCTNEVEPNDDPRQANTLAPSRCGDINPAGESDFLTFQLAPTSSSLQIKFDGKVTLKVEVGGNAVTLGNGKFPAVPFVKGEVYLIEVKATQKAASTPWRVDLLEQ